MKTVIKPRVGLLNGQPYTPAASTDIRRTWALHGWLPPSVARSVPAAAARVSPFVKVVRK